MGVALENARLFDETKRLLTETDQRAAELAIINEIGAALAEQLEFQAIVDLVGERVRSIFNPQSMFIAVYDPATNTMACPYDIDADPRGASSAACARARDDDPHHPDRSIGPPGDGRRGKRRSGRCRSAARTRSRSSSSEPTRTGRAVWMMRLVRPGPSSRGAR